MCFRPTGQGKIKTSAHSSLHMQAGFDYLRFLVKRASSRSASISEHVVLDDGVLLRVSPFRMLPRFVHEVDSVAFWHPLKPFLTVFLPSFGILSGSPLLSFFSTSLLVFSDLLVCLLFRCPFLGLLLLLLFFFRSLDRLSRGIQLHG